MISVLDVSALPLLDIVFFMPTFFGGEDDDDDGDDLPFDNFPDFPDLLDFDFDEDSAPLSHPRRDDSLDEPSKLYFVIDVRLP